MYICIYTYVLLLHHVKKKTIENNHLRKFPYLSEKVSWKHQFEQIFKIYRNSNIFTLSGSILFFMKWRSASAWEATRWPQERSQEAS